MNSDLLMGAMNLWERLVNCITMKAACEDADTIFALEDAVQTKQTKLKTLIAVYELDKKLFQGVDMEIGSDAESDGTNDDEVDEKAAIEQVMRLEFANATREAASEEEVLVRDDVFITSDVNAVLALTKTKAQIGYKKRILEDLDEDKENDPTAKTTMQAELATLEETAAKQRRGVDKAKRGKVLRDRKGELESAKRSAATQASPTLPLTPPSKKQRGGLDTMAASPSSPELSSAKPLPADDTSGPVPPSKVIESMLADADICVKIFYTPHDISSHSPQWGTGTSFDVFETLVGADGLEYPLVAKGATAGKAFDLLEKWAGEVVTVQHVKFATYKGIPQLELLEDFEILEAIENKAKQELQRQQIKRCSFKHIPEKKNGSKVALGPCLINNASESKHDKNGRPYRSARLTDESGFVANVMVWGSLAQMENIWQNGKIVDIMGADISHSEQRVNLRNCSQITLSAKPDNFKKKNQLSFIPWPEKQTW